MKEDKRSSARWKKLWWGLRGFCVNNRWRMTMMNDDDESKSKRFWKFSDPQTAWKWFRGEKWYTATTATAHLLIYLLHCQLKQATTAPKSTKLLQAPVRSEVETSFPLFHLSSSGSSFKGERLYNLRTHVFLFCRSPLRFFSSSTKTAPELIVRIPRLKTTGRRDEVQGCRDAEEVKIAGVRGGEGWMIWCHMIGCSSLGSEQSKGEE